MFGFLKNRTRPDDKQRAYEQAVEDFRAAGITSETPEAIDAAHKVLETFDDLHGGNPPIDMTPRIDGVPIGSKRVIK